MATNLSLDPKLIERALEVSGERTKNAAVTRALEEFIAQRTQKLEEFPELKHLKHRISVHARSTWRRSEAGTRPWSTG